MSDYIEGPWSAEELPTGMTHVRGPEGEPVCCLKTKRCRTRRSRFEKTVRVLTAAPDIFEACKSPCALLRGDRKNDFGGLGDDDAITMTVKIRAGDLRALRDVLAFVDREPTQ